MLSNLQAFDVPKIIRDIHGNEYNAVGSFDIYGKTYYICPIDICGSIIVVVINV